MLFFTFVKILLLLHNYLFQQFPVIHLHNFSIVRPNSSMMKVASKRLTDSNIVQRSIWQVKHAPGINVGRTD